MRKKTQFIAVDHYIVYLLNDVVTSSYYAFIDRWLIILGNLARRTYSVDITQHCDRGSPGNDVGRQMPCVQHLMVSISEDHLASITFGSTTGAPHSVTPTPLR